MDGVNDADGLGITFAPIPFEYMVEVVFPLSMDGIPGFESAYCIRMHRASVAKVLSTADGKGKQNSQAQQSVQRKYTGSYIVEVEGEHVVTCNDILQQLAVIASGTKPPQSVCVLLAPERQPSSLFPPASLYG
jgi:hypothetical protein